MREQIIYYDIDRLDRISYYIAGFQLNQRKHNYQFSVKKNLPKFLQAAPFIGEWQYYLFAVGLFKYRKRNTEFYFVIDRSDHSTNKMKEGYLLPLLEKVSFYFKVNYNPKEIEADPDIYQYRKKIFPLSPSFPIRVPKIGSFLPLALPIGANRRGIRRPRERLNHIFMAPALNQFHRWRQVKPDLDVFYILLYYGQSHHHSLSSFRNQVMLSLKKRSHLKTVVGFASNTKLPASLESLKQPLLGMNEYLEQLARSKVAIYVRGPHDGISSKFCQLLAMGKPIVGQTIANNREILYKNRFFDQQFTFDDPEELTSRVDELIHQPDEIDMLARANAETFDRYLAPEVAVSGLLEVIQKRV